MKPDEFVKLSSSPESVSAAAHENKSAADETKQPTASLNIAN